MIENWIMQLNNKDKISVVIMDITKVFDTLNQKLLTEKLEAYGLGSDSSSVFQNYLTKRYQRIRIEDCFSKRDCSWRCSNVISLDIFLFDIFSNDIFFYAD